MTLFQDSLVLVLRAFGNKQDVAGLVSLNGSRVIYGELAVKDISGVPLEAPVGLDKSVGEFNKPDLPAAVNHRLETDPFGGFIPWQRFKVDPMAHSIPSVSSFS